MVYMGMGQKNIIYHGLIHRQRHILKYIDSLLHSVIHQNMLSGSLQIMTASRNLMVCPNKHQFHDNPSLSFPDSFFILLLFRFLLYFKAFAVS